MVLLAVLSVGSGACRILCTKEPCCMVRSLIMLSKMGFKPCSGLFFCRIDASSPFTLAKITFFLCFKTPFGFDNLLLAVTAYSTLGD